MPDPGYGPNGERLDSIGRVLFEANAPPRLVLEAFEQWHIRALGFTSVPFLAQADQEVFDHVYPGGGPPYEIPDDTAQTSPEETPEIELTWDDQTLIGWE